jgi:hypothetical protein
MPEKADLFKEELDQLSDQEIEARLAAAVWVDDKRAAVLRYLEEKKLGRKKAAQSGELEIARSAKEAAWVAVDVAKDAQRRKTRTHYCRPGGGGSYRSSRSCGGHCLSETVRGAACPPRGRFQF